MKFSKSEKILLVALLVCLAASLVFLGIFSVREKGSAANFLTENQAAPGVELTVFDVGEGDSIFIKTKDNRKILIDGGPDSSVVGQLGREMPFFDRQIDLMVLTHPHADHISGLIEVLRRYQVKQILYSGVSHASADYLEWLKETDKRKIPLKIARAGQAIDLGDGIELDVLYPSESLAGQETDNLNNSSVVTKLVFGEISFLLMGDAEAGVEQQLLAGGADLKANVLKVAHHGSSTSMTEAFLEKVSPEFAVISLGENDFGHPSLRILKRLERAGAKIFRTDRDGNVKFSSDGTKVSVMTEADSF